jgi:predicted short-subunit dehydrogenase-like oxidoreductase (DUF2520 family)
MSSYLIIGSGRLASHFTHYFRLLNLQFKTWSRQTGTPSELQELAKDSTHILLLIRDDAIEGFVRENPFLTSGPARLVHCSGALNFPFAESAHPLNTFGETLYDLETYLRTPFVLETGRAPLNDILPGLPNPHYSIPSEKKALYHALCVASGNFTTLLWQNAFSSFEKDLQLPREVLAPFLAQVASNLVTESAPLTGPIARGDRSTIIRNLDALRSRPDQNLYYAFLNFVLEKNHKLGDLHYERLSV